MFKSIINFICLILCLATIEYVCFVKDYKELMNMVKYVEYDINNSDLKSFSNEKYEVIINQESNNSVSYEIILKRDSLFDIKKLKTIKYRRLVG